jgi:putative peptide zinc metalloprotease protein
MTRGASTSPAGLLDPERSGEALAGDDGTRPGGPPGSEARFVPARAEGVTLIGEFEQSGFEQPPSLVRRKDGQVVQLTELLYLTLEAVDGRRDLDEIAAELSRRLGRTATADNVRFLLDEKLRPLGVLKNRDGSEPAIRKTSPLLALRWKVTLSGENLTNRLTAPFARLFHRPVVLVALLGFVAVCGWVLFIRGMAQGTRQALYSPGLLLMVFALTVLSAGFHEFGHAAACRFSGGRPGVMGAGIYLVWPAFYTDVTDAYRLDRRGRLRTSLGGLYFNTLFVLAAFGAWAVSGSEVFLLFVPIQLFQMLHQLLPVVRMDGYHILSDLTGVPDLFARIKPTLKSAVPGQDSDQRATQLKPWVRVTVTAWVLIVVPLLLFSLVLAAIALPRMAATAWDSMGHQWDAVGREFGDGRWLGVASGLVAIVALVLPLAGSVYMLARMARRMAGRGWRATASKPVLRALALTGGALSVAFLAWLWWPNGEYEPISPGERGTLSEGIDAAAQIRSGRPALIAPKEAQLEAVPEAPLDSTDSPLEDTAGDQDETTDTTVAAVDDDEAVPASTPTTAATAPSTTLGPRTSTPTTVDPGPAAETTGEPTS